MEVSVAYILHAWKRSPGACESSDDIVPVLRNHVGLSLSRRINVDAIPDD